MSNTILRPQSSSETMAVNDRFMLKTGLRWWVYEAKVNGDRLVGKTIRYRQALAWLNVKELT